MVLSRLAASGLLLLALLALSVDGKPVQQWAQGGWPRPGPEIPPLKVQQWAQGGWPRPGPEIPPLTVQQWAQNWPHPQIPPLTVQQWAQLGPPPRPQIPPLHPIGCRRAKGRRRPRRRRGRCGTCAPTASRRGKIGAGWCTTTTTQQ
uniref:Bradykinin-potentiating protein n=1 Tax=Bothrops insularis TaxID=8723 RepID=Q8QG90_BOTIN|nr:bradykinin-potentiating protein precursor [Bothrops insularis]